MADDYDLIVIGGGPGGSTAATFVAMQGHRVLLLEREELPTYKIGESLLPSTVNGICAMLVPDDWASSGNGRGFTASGARFTLFGNYLAGDSEWTAAVNIIATVAAGAHAESHAAADAISYATSNGASYEIRRRIGDRYCDFSVAASTPASDEERAIWVAVGASMTAASDATATS